MTNITNQNWKTAAKNILKHKDLADEVKAQILNLIEGECQALCSVNGDCMLWKSKPEDLKSFCFERLESDLRRLSPFLLSVLSTVTKKSLPATCAAASIAVRGRDPRLSAFAYYLNSILQYGGAKKAVFERFCKMGITTNHSNAVGKQKELANTCGAAVQALKQDIEEYLKTAEADGDDGEPGLHQEMDDLNRSMEDLQVLGEINVSHLLSLCNRNPS